MSITTPPAASGTTGHQSCPVWGSLGVVVVVAGAVVVVVDTTEVVVADVVVVVVCVAVPPLVLREGL